MKLAMVDIETLGVNADATVLSVGAVIADTGHPDFQNWTRYYNVLNLTTQWRRGRSVDQSTLEFWSKQDMRASHVIAEAFLQQSSNLEILNPFLNLVNQADEIWALGQFDLPILGHLARQLGFGESGPNPALPVNGHLWSFRKERDLRTLSKTFPQVERPERSEFLPVHDAHADAIHQMEWLLKIREFMKSLDILPETCVPPEPETSPLDGLEPSPEPA